MKEKKKKKKKLWMKKSIVYKNKNKTKKLKIKTYYTKILQICIMLLVIKIDMKYLRKIVNFKSRKITKNIIFK